MSFLPRCEQCANCAADGRLPCTAGSKSNGEGSLLHGSMHLSRGGETVYHHLGVSGFATHAVVDGPPRYPSATISRRTSPPSSAARSSPEAAPC